MTLVYIAQDSRINTITFGNVATHRHLSDSQDLKNAIMTAATVAMSNSGQDGR